RRLGGDLGVLNDRAAGEEPVRVTGAEEDQPAGAVEVADPAKGLPSLGSVRLDRAARPERIDDRADDQPGSRGEGEQGAERAAPRAGVISIRPPTTATMPGISCVSHCFAEKFQLASLKKPKLKAGPISAATITQAPISAIRNPNGIARGVQAVVRSRAMPGLCA